MMDGIVSGVTADASATVFPGSGELAQLCRALDWSATPLGPVSRWPVSLRTAVGIVLRSPFPMVVLWGPDLVQIYNDAYRAVMDAKHPAGLGQPTRDCWPEAWEFNAPICERVLERGESVFFENRPFRLVRRGYPEEAHFTAAYGPVPDDRGGVGGVLVTVFETTSMVREREAAEERRRADRALRESEERFRALVSDTSCAVYRMSPDWSEMRQLDGRGFIADTSVPTPDWLEKYIDPEDRPQLLEAIAAAIRAKAPFELVHRIRRVDGTLGWTHSRAVPLLDPDGEIREWFGAAGDISARKQAEEALAESGGRLRLALQAARAGTWEWDVATNANVWSEELWSVYGLAPGSCEPSFEAWLASIHPDDREGVARAVAALAAEGAEVVLEWRVKDGDGAERWLMSRGQPVRDEAGRVVRYVGVAIDITRSKQAEAALRASEQRLQRIANVEGVGVMHWEVATGVLVDANDAFLRMSGYDREDLRSRSLTWRSLTPPEYVPESERQLRFLELTGRLGPYEKEYLRKDGSRTWMLFAGAALGDGMLIEYCIDVSDRKKAEAALRDAKEAAEKANQVKTQFLSTLSHELRTPLTAIIGFADLIASEVVGPTSAKQKEYLGRIDASAWHLVSIIDEILTYSRTEAGKERTRIARADVAEIVRSVVGLLMDQARARALALTLSGAEEPLVAQTDGGKVRQILVNLVGNAIRYTDRGSVHVALERTEESIELRVRDTGPGISLERQEEIFDPFVQLDGGSTREHGGTGLGLTICRRLARMLGGDVTLESAPGAGSTFTVRLPRSAAKETLLVE